MRGCLREGRSQWRNRLPRVCGKGVAGVRRILSVLSEALGRPIGHGCWVDPTMGGGANTAGRVEAECPSEYRDPARLGTAAIGEDGASAPRPSRAGS